jgi:hypothetical protein
MTDWIIQTERVFTMVGAFIGLLIYEFDCLLGLFKGIPNL